MSVKTLIRQFLVIAGLASLAAGATLVIQGEIDRRQGDEKFEQAQQVLRESIDVVGEAESNSPQTTTPGESSNPAATSDPTAGGRAIARFQIPKIDLDVVAVRYGRYADLEIGLGWMPESAPVGTPGTSIVVGHRTLFGSPLRRSDELQQGDTFTVTLASGEVLEYVIKRTSIRRPSDSFSDLIAESSVTRLVLVTCHPENSTEFRLLVVADVVASA